MELSDSSRNVFDGARGCQHGISIDRSSESRVLGRARRPRSRGGADPRADQALRQRRAAGPGACAASTGTFTRAEMTLIVGPSGCGKTTLLSVIAGILDCDDGEVSIFGHELTAMSDRAADAVPGGEHRVRVSAIQPAAGALGRRERGDPAGDRRLVEDTSGAAAPARCWRRWAWGEARPVCRPSSPAARCSGWRSRGPWFTSLGCWSATSRPPRSTTKPG